MGQYPIIIVGGGIVGLCMGLFLKKNDIPFVIFDTSCQDDDVRTLFINRTHVHFLTSLGLSFDNSNVKSIVIENRSQGVSSCYDTYHPYIAKMVIFKDLKHQLQSLAKDHIIQRNYENYQLLSGQLLIAADGCHSKVRRHVNIDILKRDYQSVARTYHIEHDHLHGKKAYEIFDKEHIIATLPLKDSNHSGVVICSSVSSPLVHHGDHLGSSRIITPVKEYPLIGVFAKKNICYPKQTILIGDAAHHYHPLAGQGLNVGLKDVIKLGRILLQAHRYGVPFVSPSVFGEYESQSTHHTLMRIFIHGVLNGPMFLKRLGTSTWYRWSFLLEGFV